MPAEHDLLGLSLTQPWATLVAIGAKRYETRGWTPLKYRGWLAIHASKEFPRDCRDLVAREPFRTVLAAVGVTSWRDLPRGSVLAIARIAHLLRTEEALRVIDSTEEAFGDYGPDRWAWRLDGVRRLAAPVPAKGALSLWPISPELRAAIDRGLAA